MRLIALALCSLIGIPASAAEVPSRWDRVSEIPKTQNVKVQLRNGAVLKGTIQDTTPDGLAFVQGQSVTHVNREDIAKITAKSRGRGALIGGIAGFAIWGGICAISAGGLLDKNNPTATDRLTGLVACGGPMGGIFAGIGAVAGVERTLYSPGK